jgi:hypothetical protein
VATDALVLWGVFLLVAVAAMVTYARLPARELYQVTNPGIDTGIKRGLAFAAFRRPGSLLQSSGCWPSISRAEW